MFLFFLSSGLFLGWSLGANDAANIFGSAVGSKMLKFKTAAIVAGIFVVIGAVVQGSGASETIGKLGEINALSGAFTVALAAALSVFVMTKYKLPVSTSQAIIGAIIGWNLFSKAPTDMTELSKIVTTWVSGPILGAAFSIIIYILTRKLLRKIKINIIKRYFYLKALVIVIGAFGAYSLGANNIANVMGVFIKTSPFKSIDILGFTFSSKQQLFAIGGVMISIGIFTYSKRVMETVGNDIFKLSSVTAIVVVLAQAMVLFIFSSSSLSNFFVSIGLPAIPLVPVSSSQIIVGAVIGVGLIKSPKNINFKILGHISIGWVITPLISGLVSYILLFFVKNVFNML